MKKNVQLRKFYDSVYRKGERSHYTQFRLQTQDMPEEFRAVLELLDWKGKDVLDVGCGTGDMCSYIAEMGAKNVVGIDYSKEAIAEAQKKHEAKNLLFQSRQLREMEGKFDIIISLGTLEHMDDPLDALKRMKGMMKPEGELVLTCPNWLNPRGYILQTLWHMFRAPITLADIHYLTPKNFDAWADDLGMELDWFTVDHEWGQGTKMVEDFKRRLPNVVRDAKMATSQAQIDEFLAWLQTCVVPFQGTEKHGGAVGVYRLRTRR